MSSYKILASLSCLIILTKAQQTNEPPRFLSGGDMQGFSIREDTPAGTSVYTLKGADPEGTDVTFSVSGDYLSVDRNTGIVTLIQPLDREKISSIETIITVTDGRIFGLEANTVPLRLDIPIVDVNDNPPTFRGTPYAFRVPENISPGATLFSDIDIVDADAGRNSEITLTCLQEETPEGCGLFDVREAKVGEGRYLGVISLAASLDYEKSTSFDLKLKAEDGGGLTSTATVEISITDVQDQPPVLLNAPYSASVREGSRPGFPVLEIIARDGDLGEAQPIRLSIEGDDSGYFALSNVATHSDATVSATLVTTRVSVDREDPIILQNGGIYTFFIRATEEGGRRESTRTKVVIVVTDEDDQKPFFSTNMTSVRVSENLADGTPLPGLDLVVTDEDVGENARFTLHLEDVSNSKGVFAVYPDSAVGRTPVVVRVINGSALDFENVKANRFAFKVVAAVKGEAVAAALVNVEVTDANDNSPIFAYPSYRFSVEEGADTHIHIATLQANDTDSGVYGEIRYSIKGFGADKFAVNSTTGEISVAPCGVHSTCLDYEQQSLYSLTYSATDGGGRVASVNVFIDVLDANDNAPQFDRVEYRRTVDEGTTFFDPQLVVKATDADGPEQGGGSVTYALQDGNVGDDEPFLVNRTSGEILIRRPLSHIDTPSSIYILTVRATDAGSPPRHSDVRVHVTVGRDKNRPPRFSKQMYRTSIKENAPAETSVTTIKARDPDGSDERISYHLGSGGGDQFFLNSTTGLISVAKGALLDRDIQPFYQLSVIAVDAGQETQQSSSAIVNITLTDVNNKPPAFNEKSYVGHVNERSSEDDIVFRVSASDPDQNSELVYEISEPVFAYDKTGITLRKNSAYDFTSAFRVNKSTGDVMVSGRLDHNEASVFVFGVRVIDSNADPDYPIQNDTAEVTIYIQVFSDKNPIFPSPWTPSKPFLEFTLKEDQQTTENVFTVAAKDPVTGRSVRRYEKVRDSDPASLFSLDPLTGQVGLNLKLDYEGSKDKKETFGVAIAGDRTSQATVVVHIEDVNDNSPQFTENEYHTRLAEDARWPKTVLQVSASDADSGEGGTVQYSLGGDDKLLFVINETTGEIRVARGAQLDRETTPTVNLEVTAYDTPSGGVTQRKTTVIVKIELTDVNDEVPQWSSNGQYTAVVAENSPVGTQVTRVHATDPDLGVNGLVTYKIPEMQQLDGLFEINGETGDITVKSPLNGKGRTFPYELGIRALDQGTPQQFSQAKLTLYIGDVSLNDGVPVFVRPKPNEIATVMENSRVGTAVFQVEAIDADSSDTANGKLIYSFLESPNNQGPFLIDPSSGLITTSGKLDREAQATHSVVVVAQDLGRPPQVASRVLLINVTDADDNDPVFVKLPGKEWQELEVEEEAAAGTVVGYVSANDRDTGPNAMIDYRITYGNEENLFGIERTSDNRGQIQVKGRIDRERNEEFILTVTCGKLGQLLPDRVPYTAADPSLLRVKVKVRDLDDNRPEFEKSVLTAGVREDAPLQTEILKLTAVDRDPTALPIRYTLYNATISQLRHGYHQLASVEAVNGTDVFLLEETTGSIRTKASLRTYAGDMFTLLVAATSNPKDKPALATITIYVLRDSELLRFVFDKNPREIRTRIPEFLQEVGDALPVADSLSVYDVNYYDDADGRIDYEKTGSCFQMLGRSLDDTRKLLDASKNQRLEKVFEKFDVKNIEPCQPRRTSRASVDWVEVWVLVIAALIGVGAGVASCAVCCLYSRYKRRVKKNLHHMRLLDSPQLVPYGPPSVVPGSIVMLPPPPHPPGPPMLMGSEAPLHRGPDWQERGIPLDAVSFDSLQR